MTSACSAASRYLIRNWPRRARNICDIVSGHWPVGNGQKVSGRALKRNSQRRESGVPLLLANIEQLLTLRPPSANRGPRRGAELGELGIINDAAVLCVAG